MSTTPNPVRSTVARITSVEELMSSFDRDVTRSRYDRAWLQRFAPRILNQIIQVHSGASVEAYALRVQLTELARRHGPRRLATLAERSGIPVERLRAIFAREYLGIGPTFAEAASITVALGGRLKLSIRSLPRRGGRRKR